MHPDPLLGRRRFTDGTERLVYLDAATGTLYVHGDDGRRVYGLWLLDDDQAEAVPVIVERRE